MLKSIKIHPLYYCTLVKTKKQTKNPKRKPKNARIQYPPDCIRSSCSSISRKIVSLDFNLTGLAKLSGFGAAWAWLASSKCNEIERSNGEELYRFTTGFWCTAAAPGPVACRFILEGLGGLIGAGGASFAFVDSFLDSKIRFVDAFRFSNQSTIDFRLEGLGDTSDFKDRFIDIGTECPWPFNCWCGSSTASPCWLLNLTCACSSKPTSNDSAVSPIEIVDERERNFNQTDS